MIISIKTRPQYRHGDDDTIATVTLLVPSDASDRRGELVVERVVESDGVTKNNAIAEALRALARELESDDSGTSDRCEAIEIALRWWSDLVVPKAQCHNRFCLERVPVDEVAPSPVDGRLWCIECIDEALLDAATAEAQIEADERARDLEYDRQEERGVEMWREARRGIGEQP